MSDQIIESYLVKLGSTVDVGSFNKFNAILKSAEHSVTSMAGGAVKDFAKVEGAIIGAFAAVGTGMVALADKAAMADQQYRLLGLRMLMGKDSARAMQLATDALGASLDEIAYDPELNRRFQDLYERNIKLGKALGANFDRDMYGIRSLRTEYKQFGVELEFLSAGTVAKLYEKLGFGSGDLLRDVRRLNDEFAENLPMWADKVSDVLVPAWKDMVVVLGTVGDDVMTLAGDFTYLIGVMNGDQGIQTTTFNIDSFGKAIRDVTDDVTKLFLTMDLLAKIGVHSATAIAGAFGALGKNFSMAGGLIPTIDWKGFKNDVGTSADQAVMAAADVRDFFGNEKNWKNNPDFAGINRFNSSHNFDPVSGARTGLLNKFAPGSEIGNNINSQQTAASGDAMKGLAMSVSQRTGIPAELIYAQWAHETNGFTSSVFNKNQNAAGIENSDKSYKSYSSLQDFADDYTKVITGSRYANAGVLGAKTTEEFAAALKKGGYYEDTQANYTAGLNRFAPQFNGDSGGGQVNIQNFNVSLPKGTPEEHVQMITDKFHDLINQNTQKLTAQVAAGAYW